MDRTELHGIVNEAIAIGAGHIARGAVDPKEMADVLIGLGDLLELERELRPPTPADLADQLVALGIKPAKFPPRTAGSSAPASTQAMR
jgi:hypothetical protein